VHGDHHMQSSPLTPVHVEGAVQPFPLCQPPLMWRSDAIQGPHRARQPSCILHYRPVQQRNHYTYHSNTTTTPQHQNTRHRHSSTSLHIAPPSLPTTSTRHAARRASPRCIICVSSSQGRKCSKPDCAAHNFTVASSHHNPFCTSGLHLWQPLLPRREQVENFQRTCPRDNKSPYSQQAYRRTEDSPEARRQTGRSWKESAPGMVRRCPAG
jgi:hypothetical protein